jgi:hypothetical protein
LGVYFFVVPLQFPEKDCNKVVRKRRQVEEKFILYLKKFDWEGIKI